MEIIIILFILLLLSVIPVKIGASILQVSGVTLGTCFLAVILSMIATWLTGKFIGEGLFPSVIALIITGIFFAWIFNTNTVTGLVLAAVSLAVQFGIVLVVAGLGFAFLL